MYPTIIFVTGTKMKDNVETLVYLAPNSAHYIAVTLHGSIYIERE